jgi:hypothetical protein
MGVFHRSLAIAIALSLVILCSGCATQHVPAATIPAGPNVVNVPSTNTIPAGPSVVTPGGAKRFAGEP